MLTLSFGFKKPQTGDRSTTWFPALEDDIQQLNDHTHNGVDSSKIVPSAIDKTNFSQTIAAAASGGWVSDGGGTYHKDITPPAGVLEINDYNVKFIRDLAVLDEQLYLSWNRLAAQSYRVYANDNTLDLLIKYV